MNEKLNKKIYGSLAEYEKAQVAKVAKNVEENKPPVYGTLKEYEEAQTDKKKKSEETAKNAKIIGLQNEIKQKKEEAKKLSEQIKKAVQSKDPVTAQAAKVLKVKMESAENKIKQLEDDIEIIKHPDKKELIVKKRELEKVFSEYKNTVEILKEKNDLLMKHNKAIEAIKDNKDKIKEYGSLKSKMEHLVAEIVALIGKSLDLKKKLIDSKFLTEDTIASALEQEGKYKNTAGYNHPGSYECRNKPRLRYVKAERRKQSGERRVKLHITS